MIALYCVRRAGEAPPRSGLVGPGGVAVRRVEEGELGAWVSAAGVGGPTAEALAAHDHVVREALRSSTPLPFRFGSRLPDEAALRSMLRERAAELGATLRRVEGRVEMGVRLRWRPASGRAEAPEAPGDVASGREYLERRREAFGRERERRERAESMVAAAEALFAPLGLPSVVRLMPDAESAALVAHLVQVAELHHYRTRAEAARSALTEVDVVVSGPWAPYSFV